MNVAEELSIEQLAQVLSNWAKACGYGYEEIGDDCRATVFGDYVAGGYWEGEIEFPVELIDDGFVCADFTAADIAAIAKVNGFEADDIRLYVESESRATEARQCAADQSWRYWAATVDQYRHDYAKSIDARAIKEEWQIAAGSFIVQVEHPNQAGVYRNEAPLMMDVQFSHKWTEPGGRRHYFNWGPRSVENWVFAQVDQLVLTQINTARLAVLPSKFVLDGSESDEPLWWAKIKNRLAHLDHDALIKATRAHRDQLAAQKVADGLRRQAIAAEVAAAESEARRFHEAFDPVAERIKFLASPFADYNGIVTARAIAQGDSAVIRLGFLAGHGVDVELDIAAGLSEKVIVGLIEDARRSRVDEDLCRREQEARAIAEAKERSAQAEKLSREQWREVMPRIEATGRSVVWDVPRKLLVVTETVRRVKRRTPIADWVTESSQNRAIAYPDQVLATGKPRPVKRR